MSPEPERTSTGQHGNDAIQDKVLDYPGVEEDAVQHHTGRGGRSNKVTVYDAAAALGVTVDAIRKRIQRGTIRHERHEDGRVYVLLDPSGNPRDQRAASQGISVSTVQDGGGHEAGVVQHKDELVEHLTDQLTYLRRIIETRDRELAARTEEIRRKDHIVATLTGHIPELPTTMSREPAMSPGRYVSEPEAAASGEGTDVTRSEQEETPPRRRSWLYRFFSGS